MGVNRSHAMARDATNLPWLVPLPYGTRPVTISYSSAPKAHTSDAVLTWPRSASGLMYGTVPHTRDSMDVRPGGSTWHCPKSHSCGSGAGTGGWGQRDDTLGWSVVIDATVLARS